MTKIALVQMRCGPDPERISPGRSISFDAAKKGAAIVCLPELFRCIFLQTKTQKLRTAEEIPGPSTSALAEWRASSSSRVASLFEKRRAGVYHNTAAIIDADGRFLGKYRKMHIPDEIRCITRNLFHAGRPRFFRRGKQSAARSVSAFCWDQWYPEAARLTALRWRRDYFLSDGDRLAFRARKKNLGAAQHSPGKINSAKSRGSQRLLRCGGEPGRSRSTGWRDGIDFGTEFICGPTARSSQKVRSIGKKS